MNLADIIIASIMVAIIIVASSTVFIFVKDSLVDTENCYAADKFSAAILEEIQPLPYADAVLTPGIHDSANTTDIELPANCKLRTSFGGSRSYTVNDVNSWDLGGTYRYKEIVATISWIYKGQNRSVSLGVLKRDDEV